MTGSPRTRASAWMRSTLAFVISGPCVKRSESMGKDALAPPAPGFCFRPNPLAPLPCRGCWIVAANAECCLLLLIRSGQPARLCNRVKARVGGAGGGLLPSPTLECSAACVPAIAYLCRASVSSLPGKFEAVDVWSVRAGAQAYLGPRPGVGSRPAT